PMIATTPDLKGMDVSIVRLWSTTRKEAGACAVGISLCCDSRFNTEFTEEERERERALRTGTAGSQGESPCGAIHAGAVLVERSLRVQDFLFLYCGVNVRRKTISTATVLLLFHEFLTS
ncbi:MAG: hypothetical protein WBY69_09185, partial [Candidatus Acidiferrales bacterium]